MSSYSLTNKQIVSTASQIEAITNDQELIDSVAHSLQTGEKVYVYEVTRFDDQGYEITGEDQMHMIYFTESACAAFVWGSDPVWIHGAYTAQEAVHAYFNPTP